MKAACIWDGLAHILSNLTCNKRNMAFSPQASINKEGGGGGCWIGLHQQCLVTFNLICKPQTCTTAMLMQTECMSGNAEPDLWPCTADSYRGRYTAEGPLMTRFSQDAQKRPRTGLYLGSSTAPQSSASDVLLPPRFHLSNPKNATKVYFHHQHRRLSVTRSA